MSELTLTIPANLVQPLVGLVDAGLRATGIKGARAAAEIVELIEAAIAANQNEQKDKANGQHHVNG